jgi:creatinine amidohydrolase
MCSPKRSKPRAAEIEPAVVFPGLFFGQIAGARHCPGTVSLDHELLFRLLVATLDEIGRNGFSKIVIVNGHGGNNGLLDDLLFSLLQRRRSYVVYATHLSVAEEDRQRWQQMCPNPGEHAGAEETSCIMYLLPEMVHMEECKDASDGDPRGMLKQLRGAKNSLWWYADYPTQLAGDPRSATAEKGRFYLDSCASALAAQIAQVKADDVSARLAGEFYSAADRGGSPRKHSR